MIVGVGFYLMGFYLHWQRDKNEGIFQRFPVELFVVSTFNERVGSRTAIYAWKEGVRSEGERKAIVNGANLARKRV